MCSQPNIGSVKPAMAKAPNRQEDLHTEQIFGGCKQDVSPSRNLRSVRQPAALIGDSTPANEIGKVLSKNV
jgi:hypothetical protein